MKYHIILNISLWLLGFSLFAQTPRKITYTYDALNRLTEVTYPNGDKTTYNYDVLGNRTSVITTGTVVCGVPTGIQWSNTTATSFQPYWNGIAGYSYVVRYRVSGTTAWTETAQIPCTITGILVTTLSGLTNGVSYEWQVKTVCGVGNESAYSASTFSSTFCQATNLNVGVVTNNSAVLTWNSFGIPLNVNLRYKVFGMTSWLSVSNISGTTYTLIGLNPSTTYEVQIQTICADGSTSGFSTSRTFNTTSSPCPASLFYGTGSLYSGAYQASQFINSSSNLSSPVSFRAGNSILLNPGFEVGPSEIFSAKIEGCLPTNGLVAYYPFNGNANDESNNGNNGTVVNATLTTDRFGKANKAYNFNGTAYIYAPSSSLSNLTVSVWFKVAQNDVNRYEKLFSFGTETIHVGVSNSYDNGANCSGALYSYGGTNTGIFHCTTSPNVSNNQWHHAVLSYSISSGKHRYYLDGNLINEVAFLNALPSFNNFIMGASNTPCCGNYYAGTRLVGILDDVRIYNRELTNSEVTQLYQSESIDPNAGLVLHLPLNNNANDASGNGFNGSLIGSPTFANRGSNPAINLNPNQGQYVSVANNTTLQNLTTMTLSAWVKPASFNLSCYTEREMIIGKGKDVSSNAFAMSILRNTTPSCGSASSFTDYKMSFELNGNSIFTPIYGIDNQWRHVVCTYDNNLQKIYINGVLIQQQTVGVVNTSNTLPLYINYATWNGGASNSNGRFGGGIDEVRVYNRALSDSEVQNLFNLEK